MKQEEGEEDPKLWSAYKEIVEGADGRRYQWAKLNREKFYEEAKKSVLIVQTGQPEACGSLILTKGNVDPQTGSTPKIKVYQQVNQTLLVSC